MRHFISAIQFITIIPVGRADTFEPPKMIPYFPVVGLALGMLTALFDQLASAIWSRPVVSLLDVLFLAVVTGAFHLDGLGDSADGLLGQRSKEKALTIMKDSRLGTMGLVAIVFGLALKWAGIAGLDANRALLLILVPAYARAGMLFGMRFLEYGRSDGGTGVDFLGLNSSGGVICVSGVDRILVKSDLCRSDCDNNLVLQTTGGMHHRRHARCNGGNSGVRPVFANFHRRGWMIHGHRR